MIISEKSPQNQTSQSTIDPLHRARAPPPPATRASRALAQRRASSTPRVRVSTVVASVSLSPLSRAFSGRFPETPRSAEEARKTRGRRADERPSRPIASTRTRARERGKISKYRARVASPVASIARSRRRRCRRGSIARRARRPTVPRFFGMQSFVPERARTRAGASHARVDGGERFEGTRSEGIGRRRARAGECERARARGGGNAGRAPGDGFGRAGRRRRAVSDPREACGRRARRFGRRSRARGRRGRRGRRARVERL